MVNQISVLLVGIGGYGNVYTKNLFHGNHESVFVKGVVDIAPERSKFYQEFKDKNIPIYDSMDQFYQENQADLAIISTPIHLHKEQACLAMEKGSHVLCEKPATANREHLQQMIETRDRTKKKLAIGFNWSFTDSIQSLKQDILAGEFGRPFRMKSLVLWPRNADYFNRTGWAGKKYSPDGEMIFDSVANNATAHFLHHLLYLSGDSIETSAEIDQISAELYRANPIETFDTCAIHLHTKNDVEIVYLASHAIADEHRPKYTLEFEDATITYHPEGERGDIVAKWHDGREKVYEDPENIHSVKLDVMIEAVRNEKQSILCGPEAASAHVNAIFGIHQSVKDIPKFPKHWIAYDEERKLTTVQGLDETLKQCYQQFCLPNDLGVEWSKPGKIVKF
ncbi:gfo/Idh/MocA family oxidoreductase [Gracilibacillus salitolerans]|uniref:Gfo/Idh/MocA family oxidoreductase n=1 Tax=Gracilibacillus salitolerans TaxID=2663022 RepID=A0A5Q2TIX4_9BACI|nr:Gfo/Idh/MocA family oxidoreductase [Gracilibacillus salitolerans]QGH33933.1 gfo/Idh/MocA family oxidoreductase [Gracilibacillus salitolerans]